MFVDLNADVGESFGAWTLEHDEALFPFLSSTKLACGFHAGDPVTMHATLKLARQFNMGVGALPSFPDRVGFRPRIPEASSEEVYADVLYHVCALAASVGVPLRQVKAHGALSICAWTHAPTAQAIAQAVYGVHPTLPLLVLPTTLLETEARKLSLPVVLELFPERAYLHDGHLAPRSLPGSSIHNPHEAACRAVTMVKEGQIQTLDGGFSEFKADTFCVHGDTPNAVEIACAIRAALEAEGIEIRAVAVPTLRRPEVPA
ncbi:LamB/YcsF family protein [Deinococcus sp. Arct2-2]|uniref:LamB/YcsF family protein n=1 Tax=Deinococcus sp. Arct2-2 TaxID=2568653 RepID=UPI0010A4D3A3|nr:5-oxoprolinase subunit PxpA [Deinococcus sp. Arct2-2]THF69892.1 LamB/YcsF family protein [Deinococcus sp. Arct2-2]THF69924.1 LamB/YcsF family protein [Deinococcus sp. Arct2-2]